VESFSVAFHRVLDVSSQFYKEDYRPDLLIVVRMVKRKLEDRDQRSR